MRGVDFGHGGAAILLALAVEPLLMRAKVGDPRLDLRPEFARAGRAAIGGVGFGGSGMAMASASRASMSGIGAGSLWCWEVGWTRGTGGATKTGVAAMLSSSGFLPVTD